MVANHKFIDIVHRCGQQGLPLEGVYRRTQDRELFLIAYSNLYSNAGALTQGANPKDTMDGKSMARIDVLMDQLKQNTYHGTPVRRTYIDKKSGGKRPLGIVSWSDKLLQEVIRIVLEAYYEPRFSDHSHGFRPERGCHTALQAIRYGWTGTKWFVEGDIRRCDDTINLDILLKILARDIKDNRFLKLIRKMLKAGYLEDWKYQATYSGVPQGSGVSPILANILLNELDRRIEQELLPTYNRGNQRRTNREYYRVKKALHRAKKKGDWERVKALKKTFSHLPSKDPHDPDYRRLYYCRYADDVRRSQAAREDTLKRVNPRERGCKASPLSRPGNRLGSVAWGKRPKSGNPQPATEGRARLDRARARLSEDQFRAVRAKTPGKVV